MHRIYLKLFFVCLSCAISDTKFIPWLSNTLQLHRLLPNSSASRCDAKCQGLAALAEHILALPTVIYSHSNLNALIKETIRKTGWAPGEYLSGVKEFIELNKGHREVIESNINKS